MRVLLGFVLVWLLASVAMATTSYSDFHVNPHSSCTNINAGSTATGSPVYTSTATVAGGWSGTVFTPDDGSTPASTVSVGMFASIYTNAVNTNAVYVGRITAVAAGVNGGITVDTVAKSGTAPTAVLGAVAAISIRVGGTWRGPYEGGSTSVTFPFNFVGPNMTNAAGNMVCVNWISGTNWTVTNAITHSVNGPIRWESYTNTAHDGGRGATISGGTTVASFVLFTASGNHNDYDGFTFLNNGATGVADGVAASGTGNMYRGCTFTGMRGSGVNVSVLGLFVECEAMTNNVANTVNKANFENVVANQVYLRCTSHDSTNINASGWHCSQAATLIECIVRNVGSNGITFATTGEPIIVKNTDLSKVRLAAIQMSSTPAVSQLVYIENSNFITNTTGLESAALAIYKRNGAFYNLGFGSGTATNANGGVTVNFSNVFASGFTTYGADLIPWVNPTNGNFRINLGPAQNTGRGNFTFTSAGYTNTLGYPDIGAAQHLPVTNGASAVFSQ